LVKEKPTNPNLTNYCKKNPKANPNFNPNLNPNLTLILTLT